MKIILDGLGGDNAPASVLEGANLAVKQFNDIDVDIIGPVDSLAHIAEEMGIHSDRIHYIPAERAMPMEAEPTSVLKEYSDSSMAVGLKRLSEDEGDAFVSAGSTGALVVGGTLIVKRIKGVKRPAIGTIIPSKSGCYMLIDSGANHECRPEMLVQFGYMGAAYLERILNVERPRVGLINIGVEETKGTDLQVEAFKQMKNAQYNFVGNVEAREVPLGGCDVAVCDGFTGNIILKTTEGLAKLFMHEIKNILTAGPLHKLSALIIKKDLKAFKKKFDSSDYGGALLLGTRKPVIKAHGSSDGKAICSAIRQARMCVSTNIISNMEEQLSTDVEKEG